MKIHPAGQGSQQWLEARAGIPTASEFDCLVTPAGEIRKGEMPRTFLARKLAEAWSGPLPGFGSFATEQGQILEGEAIPFAEFQFGWKVNRVGLITTDDGRVGCSPDGLIGEDCGLEIKCPESPTHIKWLLDGGIPKDHFAQVQGGLYVTGLPSWRFVSYRRHYPSLVVAVLPDPSFQQALNDALFVFLAKFDAAMTLLIELNGGPPPKREPMVFVDEIQRGEAQEIGITP